MRRKIIKELKSRLIITASRLKGPKIDKNRILKDFALFCELEKEIQIQESYLNHERE